ncbi:MAG: hypothetical protein EP344_14985 [Bacteroidetes bacterium]|nr:MAG: hypothetical protein EP344_14985 [Bacteroidota bacterium]
MNCLTGMDITITMKKIVGFGFVLGLLFSCGNPAPEPAASAAQSDTVTARETPARPRTIAPPAMQTLRGMYYQEGTRAYFYDCTSATTLPVGSQPPEANTLYREVCQPTPYPGEPVYAVVEALVRPATAGTPETVDILHFDTCVARTMYTACRPYDYWCIGTEPYWGVVISEKEGRISFKRMGDEVGLAMDWKAPRTIDGTRVYETRDPASGALFRVAVRPESCSDGMSDRVYTHSVEIDWNGEKLRGCAVRYGNVPARE